MGLIKSQFKFIEIMRDIIGNLYLIPILSDGTYTYLIYRDAVQNGVSVKNDGG